MACAGGLRPAKHTRVLANAKRLAGSPAARAHLSPAARARLSPAARARLSRPLPRARLSRPLSRARRSEVLPTYPYRPTLSFYYIDNTFTIVWWIVPNFMAGQRTVESCYELWMISFSISCSQTYHSNIVVFCCKLTVNVEKTNRQTKKTYA